MRARTGVYRAEETELNLRPKKKLLLVDDDEGVLAVRRFFFETRGFKVYWAETAEEAIALFAQIDINLVMTDLGLPGMDGNKLIGELKKIQPSVPMILVSSSVRSGERAHRADCFLGVGQTSPAEMLERVKIMTARKRGPKKVLAFPEFAQK